MKIVVIEDEIHSRLGLYELIQSFGEPYKLVGEASDGYEGLRMIKELSPDVVITDIRMPKVDGLKMISDIRSCNSDVRFVILSGYADFEYAKQGIVLGIEDYLLKPITPRILRETLDRIYQKSLKPEQPPIPESPVCSPVVRSITEDIQKNYAQKLSLDGYAERFKMTPEHISRLFAKELGVTFSTYLTDMRMEKAKELLLNKNLKSYEIACMVGYNDAQYFCRAFKKAEGISTKEYIVKYNK